MSFMNSFPIGNEIGEYATAATCAAAVQRVRAHAAAGNRVSWWMDQERAELRKDPAWCKVFDHLSEAHTGAAVAAFLGGAK